MGPELPKPKPAAWQGLPNVSTSLPGHTWMPRGRAEPRAAPWAGAGTKREVAQIQVTSGASASTPRCSPRQNSWEQLWPHSTPPPSFGMRGIHPKGHRKPGAAAGQEGSFPISRSKPISIPLCCHARCPAPPRDQLGSVGPGDPGDLRGGGARGALPGLFLGWRRGRRSNDNCSWHFGMFVPHGELGPAPAQAARKVQGLVGIKG